MIDKNKIKIEMEKYFISFRNSIKDKIEYNQTIIETITNSKIKNKDEKIEKIKNCAEGILFGFDGEEKYVILPLLCKQKYCAICKYYFIERQRQAILTSYQTLKQIIRKDIKSLYFGVLTKVGKDKQNAYDSLCEIKEMMKETFKENRKKSIILGGFYKIEYTFSTFKFQNWHYHTNFIVESLYEEKEVSNFFSGMFNTIAEFHKIEDLNEKNIKEIIKYSAKDENKKLKPWNVNPLENSKLLSELDEIFKKRHLSLIQSWYGLKGLYEDLLKIPSGMNFYSLKQDQIQDFVSEML